MPANRPLPWCAGAKLAPFKFDETPDQDITILGHLGGGLHSEVFKARIQGKDFALKVVRNARSLVSFERLLRLCSFAFSGQTS